MSTKKGISFEKTMEIKNAIAYLEDLVKSLKERKIVIEQGSSQCISLTPPDSINVLIKAKQKKGKEKLSFEFSWEIKKEGIETEEGLKISSEEPAPPSGPEQE